MSDTLVPLSGKPAATSDARVGRVIEVLLDLMGIAKQDLAAQIGMSAGYLGQKISGSRSWKYREIEQVATALGVPKSLLGVDPEEILSILVEPGRSINYRSSA